MLQHRAHQRLRIGDRGDDGHGSVTHTFSWVDDVTIAVPLCDLAFFMVTFERLTWNIANLRINKFKTRIQTSTTGTSIMGDLRQHNPHLAKDVWRTIETYSTSPGANAGAPPEPVEVTSGWRLLGTPVGSAKFAESFFQEKLDEVSRQTTLLHHKVPDLQTRLRLFSQCVLQKLPHLLGADIMHRLPLLYDADFWFDWNGPLTQGIESVASTFLATVAGRGSIPTRSLLVSQIAVMEGGLGLTAPSYRAAPDFVLGMTAAM